MGKILGNQTARALEQSLRRPEPRAVQPVRQPMAAGIKLAKVLSRVGTGTGPYKYLCELANGRYSNTGGAATSIATGIELWSDEALIVGNYYHCALSYGNHWEVIAGGSSSTTITGTTPYFAIGEDPAHLSEFLITLAVLLADGYICSIPSIACNTYCGSAEMVNIGQYDYPIYGDLHVDDMAVTIYAAFNRPTETTFDLVDSRPPAAFVQWFARWTAAGIATPKVARILTLALGLELGIYNSDFIVLFEETNSTAIPDCDIAIPVAYKAPEPSRPFGTPRAWQRARFEPYVFA